MELLARRLRTVESNNDFIVIFERGDITKPIIFISELDAKNLLKELQNALKDKE